MDLDRLRELESEGLITLRPNSEADLLIANYTSKVQYDRLWTDELMQLRGLIVDMEGNVVARPFPKFFNLEEHDTIPDEPFDCYEKMDGSLGIVYWWNHTWNVSTRGSMSSEQAQEGFKILHKQYTPDDLASLSKDTTYLMEIIYPENRIVVDYSGERRMVFLGAYRTEDGFDYGNTRCAFINEPWPDRVRKFELDLENLDKSQNLDDEGYVIRFKSGLRMKIKFDEYVRLHRIVTGVSSRTVWEYLRDGTDFKELTERVPDEFYQWLCKQRIELEEQFLGVMDRAKRIFNSAPEFETRKDFALWAKDQIDPSLLFSLLDGKDIRPMVWKMIKPERTLPYAGAHE